MGLLPDGTEIGTVRLRVADVARQSAFYSEVLGLRVLSAAAAARSGSGTHTDQGAAGAPEVAARELAAAGEVALGARRDGRPLLVLQPSPDAPPAPRASTGLFHVALLLPSRRALAEAVLRVRSAGWPFQGFADHAVSEAAYLADAEGNGLELYADRARSEWIRTGGEYHITTLPLDLDDLLSQASGPGDGAGRGGDQQEPPPHVHEQARVGHVHLRVSSLASAERFYVHRMGFDVTASGYPGALFVAAGGYHHHLGLNVWAGTGAPRPPPGSRGLVSFEVVVPDAAARRRLLNGSDSGTLEDQDGNLVRVVETAR
jgi:catechol 2,3-dioxygenase